MHIILIAMAGMTSTLLIARDFMKNGSINSIALSVLIGCVLSYCIIAYLEKHHKGSGTKTKL